MLGTIFDDKFIKLTLAPKRLQNQPGHPHDVQNALRSTLYLTGDVEDICTVVLAL